MIDINHILKEKPINCLACPGLDPTNQPKKSMNSLQNLKFLKILTNIWNWGHVEQFYEIFEIFNWLAKAKYLQDNFSDIHESNLGSKFSNF
jgi:hypothetical protein